MCTVRRQLNHKRENAQFVFVALRYFSLWTRTGQEIRIPQLVPELYSEMSHQCSYKSKLSRPLLIHKFSKC
jgi:hypothetical protein